MSRADPVRQSYDRLAPIYDRRWQSYEEATLQTVITALECQGADRLLDIACGTGELERLLLAHWPQLWFVGVDLSRGMLQQAVGKGTSPQVFWLQAEAGRLPLGDGSFDWVVCANSFHYFRQPIAALREARRVLRPGGRLVLVDWCDDYLTCKVCSWWLRWTDPAFYRTYATEECQALLRLAGWEVVHHERFRVGWLWGLMRFVCRPTLR